MAQYQETLVGLKTDQDRTIAERGVGIGGGTLGKVAFFPVQFTNRYFGIVTVDHDANGRPIKPTEWALGKLPKAAKAIRRSRKMPEIFSLGDSTVILGRKKNGKRFVIRLYYSEGAEMYHDFYTTRRKEYWQYKRIQKSTKRLSISREKRKT